VLSSKGVKGETAPFTRHCEAEGWDERRGRGSLLSGNKTKQRFPCRLRCTRDGDCHGRASLAVTVEGDKTATKVEPVPLLEGVAAGRGSSVFLLCQELEN